MIRLAVSGHRQLPEQTARVVDAALRAELRRHADGELIGLSCLADGADALFAQAVLDLGGALVAIIPAHQYRAGLPESHHSTYDALLARASDVVRLDHIESDAEAHMAASLRMLDAADRLMAVWDGLPARGHGGTADVVRAARERGIPVTVVWPPGAQRG
ncbi:hypothetical protein GCM10012275_42080 [Longimycelium tulufanense]|uniref:DNA recombination-mediator protein A n=1 Tax=Longimycelium tulufanense TaxID=907463 RepID=A0A8J3FWK1_9PSEU|nr:hypothetical protein [Longimycelium tulufanense]GGM67150.1 hypothetical protein GCM10012275_42080 [Longimycelium tulufanense]